MFLLTSVVYGSVPKFNLAVISTLASVSRVCAWPTADDVADLRSSNRTSPHGGLSRGSSSSPARPSSWSAWRSGNNSSLAFHPCVHTARVAYRHHVSESSENPVLRVSSDVAGRGIAVLFAAIKLVRRPRPIHPRGEIFEGQIEWAQSTGTVSGISWIDSPPASGRQDVTVRVSRSVGLTPPLPDVIGLAFRFRTKEGDADLALASSWLGLPGRFMLRLGRSADGTFASLMPYRGDFGPVEISARTAKSSDGRWDVELLHATSTSTWRKFATVHLDAQALPDRADLRFDPIENALPGAGTYPWTRRLRQRSYVVARKA
jgi:hypothetical protein